LKLSPDDIKKIEALLTDHQTGAPRDAILKKYNIRHFSQLGGFVNVLRRLRINLPVSPNLRNGGKRILHTRPPVT
jgi:hypothetical protein